MADLAVIPQKTALVNLDMQNCFVADSPVSAPDGLIVLDRINRLASACRQAGILVIHTAFVLNPDNAGIPTQGSATGALHQKLVVATSDIILENPHFSAFQGTDLELILRSRAIDTIIISGVLTNLCCKTTARQAMLRGFHVFFLSDGTAAAPTDFPSADEPPMATLSTLGFLFAQVLTVDAMLARIEQSRSASEV